MTKPISIYDDPDYPAEEKADFQLLTYSNLSKILKRSESTLRQDVMKRRIPFIKIGGSIRFDPLEIEKWLKSQSIPIREKKAKKHGKVISTMG